MYASRAQRVGSTRTRTGGRSGLLRNLAVGQRLLQFGDACVGDLGAADAEEIAAPHACWALGKSLVGDG